MPGDYDLLENHRKIQKLFSVEVKISHEEVLKVVVNDLVGKRNASTNNIRDSFDAVLRYYLTEDEFQSFVIEGNPVS